MKKYFLIAAVLFAAGCQKDPEMMNTRQVSTGGMPQIRILQPQSQQGFNSGDEVRIYGRAIDDDLWRGDFEVKDARSGHIYFTKSMQFAAHDNGDFNFNFPMQTRFNRRAILLVTVRDRMNHTATARVPMFFKGSQGDAPEEVQKMDHLHGSN